MALLVDTHLLLWFARGDTRISDQARRLIEDADMAFFSCVSLWEITIKFGLKRDDFQTDPIELRRELLRHHFDELQVTSEHVLAVLQLPQIHKDPFDRILIAQASVEAMTFLTSDKLAARYPGSIHLV